ncbi:hypothetical protein G7046_g5156 [Stylonectria norvegica]|nr:hypothetical protein G7046_g5156 [Stylonectria norvegica]
MRFSHLLVPTAVFFSTTLAQGTSVSADATDSLSEATSEATSGVTSEPTALQSSTKTETIKTFVTFVSGSTTFCPEPTSFVHHNVTHTATTEALVTISNEKPSQQQPPYHAQNTTYTQITYTRTYGTQDTFFTQPTQQTTIEVSQAPLAPPAETSPQGPSPTNGGASSFETKTFVSPTATGAVDAVPTAGATRNAGAGFTALVVAFVAALAM